MRRLVVWNVMTLDGYCEGRTPWDLGLLETVWGDELEAFSLEQGQEIGTLLFGRRSPSIGPSRTQGAHSPLKREPAVKAVVFQWPCGTAAQQPSPFLVRPRSPAILIDRPVSSTKTAFVTYVERGLVR